METIGILILMALIMYGLYTLGATKGNDALEDAQVLNFMADGKPHYVYGDLDKYSGVKHPQIWVVIARLERQEKIYRWQESNKAGQRVMYAIKN